MAYSQELRGYEESGLGSRILTGSERQSVDLTEVWNSKMMTQFCEVEVGPGSGGGVGMRSRLSIAIQFGLLGLDSQQIMLGIPILEGSANACGFKSADGGFIVS